MTGCACIRNLCSDHDSIAFQNRKSLGWRRYWLQVGCEATSRTFSVYLLLQQGKAAYALHSSSRIL